MSPVAWFTSRKLQLIDDGANQSIKPDCGEHHDLLVEMTGDFQDVPLPYVSANGAEPEAEAGSYIRVGFRGFSIIIKAST